MKRNLLILLAATGMVVAGSQARAQSNCPGPQGGQTALQAAAASLSAGQYCDLNSTGLVGNTLRPDTGYDSALTWTDSGVWDPVHREVRWIGRQAGCGDASRPMRHLIYSEASNTWSYDDNPGGIYYCGHGYDHNAVNPATGVSYFRKFSGNAFSYNPSTGGWTELAGTGNSASASGLAYFPELHLGGATGGLVVADGSSGGVRAYIDGRWTQLAGTLSPGIGVIHNFAEYNPVHGFVMFGGGNEGANTVYRLNADGSTTLLDSSAPVSMGTSGTSQGYVVVDPAGGSYLVYSKDSNRWWSYDPIAGSWQNTSTPPPDDSSGSDRLFLTPIRDYGVIMMVTDRGNGNAAAGVWIYRHSDGSGNAQIPNPPTQLRVAGSP